MSLSTIFLTALISTVLAADVPVTVSDVVTGPSSHVRLTNTAMQPVTPKATFISHTFTASSKQPVANGWVE